MPTPTKDDIRAQAHKELAQINRELGITITPEDEELKESGLWQKAQGDLMATRAKPEAAQRKYAEQMAGDIGMELIPKQQWKRDVPKIQAFEAFHKAHPKMVVRINGYRIKVPEAGKVVLEKKRKPKVPVARVSLRKPLDVGSMIRGAPLRLPKAVTAKVPKVVPEAPRKKRQRLHTSRVGKTPRKLNGFRFGDDVWKVRKR